MAKSPLRPSPARPLRVAGFWPGLLLLCLLAPVALAKSSLRPITDIEVREKKQACYADIERWSIIDKENCALRCLSPVCFQLIYESDPLEEGENDFVRGQEFKYCMRKCNVNTFGEIRSIPKWEVATQCASHRHIMGWLERLLHRINKQHLRGFGSY
ncbi:hypothetical protein MUK42_30970 [Musa troglodytarum]|uniref:Uncharacterized protein n=1 Tax=Musa troglodytarum TaxID=320322 RepID=A0A9E7FLK8_9LILI|nr:hypothetical protein MUK42_30970 [Musa troglodytarum]